MSVGANAMGHPSIMNRTVRFNNPVGAYSTGGMNQAAYNPGAAVVQQDHGITDDFGRQYGSGANTANERVTMSYFMDRNEWQDHHTGANQLTFACTATDGKGGSLVSHRMLSLSMLNRQLKWNAKFQRMYNSRSARQLAKDWRFVGVQLNEDINKIDENIDHVQVYSVRGRARCWNYWQAINTRSQWKKGISVQEPNELYLVLRRYKFSTEDQVMGHKPAVDHYWQYEPFISESHQRPPVFTYQCPARHEWRTDPKDNKEKPVLVEEGWAGHFIRIGYCHSMIGADKAAKPELRITTREALCPRQDSNEYKYQLNEISELVIMLA